MANPYVKPTIGPDFLLNPPVDDGSQTENNRVKFDKHVDKIAKPLETYTDDNIAAIDAAIAKMIGGGIPIVVSITRPGLATDQGQLLSLITAGITHTTPNADSVDAPFVYALVNNSSGNINIAGFSTQTINGTAGNIVVSPGGGGYLWTDGVNWFSPFLGGTLTSAPFLTSIQDRAITLTDAGKDAFLAWHDSASAYENISSADATAILDPATPSVKGLQSPADKTKLDGIATGAEVNPDLIPQPEAEAGTATTERVISAQRLSQAIDSLGLSQDDITALPNLASLAGTSGSFTMPPGVVKEEGIDLNNNTIITFGGSDVLAEFGGVIQLINIKNLSSITRTTILGSLNFSRRVVDRTAKSSFTTSTTTSLIPFDNTKPLITEGFQLFSTTYSPDFTSSVIEVRAKTIVSCTIATTVTISLFVDGVFQTAETITITLANFPWQISLTHLGFPPALAATPYEIRIGAADASTLTINGVNGSPKLGNGFSSTLTIVETASE